MEGQEWEQQPGETRQAYAAFCVYRDAGTGRSLAKVRQEYSKSIALLTRWSSRWSWVDRSAAYDKYMAGLEQAERERALVAEAQKWAERRMLQREREWEASEALLGRAKLMLDHPTTQERQSADGKVIIVEPAGWTQRDISTFMESGSKLARLASEMETERKAYDIPDASDALDRLTRELSRIAARSGAGSGVEGVGSDTIGGGSPAI